MFKNILRQLSLVLFSTKYSQNEELNTLTGTTYFLSMPIYTKDLADNKLNNS